MQNVIHIKAKRSSIVDNHPVIKRMGLKMIKNTSKKKSAAGRQNRLRPDAKATTKPIKQRVEQKNSTYPKPGRFITSQLPFV
jgi:hypothetical protein